MALMEINGAQLDVRERGSGEAVMFIHGGMGDECAAVVREPALTGNYRVIDYHRRGWGDSTCPDPPVTFAQQSEDCRAILRRLGAERAHIVGQSYGGAIALQVARDEPGVVQSLSLLEPALPSVLFGSAEFGAGFGEVVTKYASGDKTGAIETFAGVVCDADSRAAFDKTLPAGHWERWLASADTMFVLEAGSLEAFSFTSEDAARIDRPVLNMRGALTKPFFVDVFNAVQEMFPRAEQAVLPGANHGMLQMNPKGAAEELADFFGRHSG